VITGMLGNSDPCRKPKT